jgi:ABC-type sugar transport system substrate-binding protein
MMLHKLRLALAAILVALAAVSAADSASAKPEIVTPANDPFFIDLERIWYP